MRTAFIEALEEAARADCRIVLVTGDLGFGVFDSYRKTLPAQFVNAGVAEQNMTGLAAGMALSGKTVFTYSIANFPVLRCLEQIRNDVCYHRANVKIVAVGGGMAYGALGVSHHATEDLAVMRALPNLVVLAPNDPIEVRWATKTAARIPGPMYLRLGRAGEAAVHEAGASLELGKAALVRQGADVTIAVTGGLLGNVMRAAELLEKDGIGARVLSVHTVKPLDEAAVLAAARETAAVFTVEEHSVMGGLGGAVAEALLEADARPSRFRRIGLNGMFASVAGDQDYLRKAFGLDAEGIAAEIRCTMTGNGRGR